MRDDSFYRYSSELKKIKTDLEKISWVEGRTNQVLIQPLEALKNIWPENRKIQCLNLGVMILICCGIESLSNFYLQKGDSGKKFRKFVEAYMSSEFKKTDLTGKKYSTLLWDDFRCGLAHCLSIEKGGILEGTNKYMRYDNEKGLGIDLWFFLDDFKKAFKKYINDVKNSNKGSMLKTNFLQRFDSLFASPRNKS